MQHSKFGGSNASRWLNCPGSVALLETVPAKGSSRYAEEGTLAHAFAAYMLENGERSIMSYVGTTLDAQVGAVPLSEEMAAAIQVYLDAVWAEFDKTPEAELYVEQRFDLEIDGTEKGDVGGTNDAMVYHPSTKRLVVFDYKHGVGVSVTAEDNDQLKFYAAGAAFSNPWPIADLILVIVQPRARDVEEMGAVREWPMDQTELLEFKAQCAAAIWTAKGGRGVPLEYQIGSWCRWCVAAPFCPAKQAEATQAFGNVDLTIPGTPEFPHPDTLIDERLAQIVATLSYLTAYANQCQEYLEARLMAGAHVPGWKVVEKIGRTKWIADEEEIAGYLSLLYDIPEDLVRPRRLTTIGDVEKLMKGAGASKADIDNFKLAKTLKESSGLTVAPEKDRRPAVNAAERAFSDVQV